MYNKCCVVNCDSRRKDVHFHRFPKTEIGLQEWLECINCERLRSLSLQDLRKQFVCQKHFEKKFLASSSSVRVKSRLRVGAFPTLFTADEISSGIPQNALGFSEKINSDLKQDHNYSIKRPHEEHNYYKVEAGINTQITEAIRQEVLTTHNPIPRFSPGMYQKRSFWEYVNMMFNKPDPERIKQVGPDRACAEWVLKNGGQVVWADGHKLSDYNSLPADDGATPKLVAIDGSDSSISHYGFSHLSGCTMLQKIILHNDKYIDDRAIKGLAYGKSTLTHVQVSKCADVSDNGIKEIKVLDKLDTLVLFDLPSVENLEECKKFLSGQLPKCKIQGN